MLVPFFLFHWRWLTSCGQLVRILGGYGALVVERTGSDVWAFLLSHDILWKYRVSFSSFSLDQEADSAMNRTIVS